MKLTKHIIWSIALIAIMYITLAANILTDTSQHNKKIKFSGMTALEVGQFVRGHHKQKEFPYRPWLVRLYGQLRFDAYIGNKLHIIFAPEIKIWNSSYPLVVIPDIANYPFKMRTQLSITNGQGIFNIVDIENIFNFQISTGIIQYKYNPDAYNLGEYLFRTGTHPSYIISAFDYSFARLPGLRTYFDFFNQKITVDAFLTFEPEVAPLLDGSISFLLGYKQQGILNKNIDFLNIGAGVSFDRCISVGGKTVKTPDDISGRSKYFTQNGEEKYFSFGGTKLMGRFSFDPKGILPDKFTSHFSKDDWKIFCEFAVLGTKDVNKYNQVITGTDTTYEIDTVENYYGNISERIPFMFGFNLPFPSIGKFRLWDICSFQMEYFGWPYTNSLYDVGFNYERPIPKPAQSYPQRAYELDSWKFSLYIKKTILNAFSIIGQVARDHSRHDIYYGAERDEEEVFTKTDDITNFGDVFNPKKWGEYGWWLKLQYNF